MSSQMNPIQTLIQHKRIETISLQPSFYVLNESTLKLYCWRSPFVTLLPGYVKNLID